MIQSIIRFFKGYVTIRIEGYGAERFLNLCRHHGIRIWGLYPDGDAYQLCLALSDVKKLRPVLRKTKVKMKIIHKTGVPFQCYRYRKRKLLFAGFFLMIFLLYGYSGRVWDIHFEGNEQKTDETLLSFLVSLDIQPGMEKEDVDCEQIVKDIRQEFTDIVWVSASIDGSRLLIQVKENEDTVTEVTENTDAPTDLIAAEDGMITSIITRSGVPLVHAGDTVKKGDILVSGRVEVLNDAGEVVNYQYRKAEAEILADTQMEYEDSMSVMYQEKIYDTKYPAYRFFASFGKFRFSIGIPFHKKENQEIFTWEQQVKLGQNFFLPLRFGYESEKNYTLRNKTRTEKEIQERLTEKFMYFSEELEEKGIHIYKNNVKIQVNETTASAKGTLFLNQDIGEAAETEIIEITENERNEENESIGTDG